ncbi:cytochrome P450 [Rhizocola hellebori]|nr:cytochrome P450 [Rhizocola hellebori]
MTPFLDLYGADFRSDPYGVLAPLRHQTWHADCAIGTAVLRYSDVQALLAMRQLRTPGAEFLAMQGITRGPLVETMRGFLLNADGEAHHRVRRLVGKAFTVRRVEDFRSTVAEIADELIDQMAQTEQADFVCAFAEPFALRVLCRFVGIPGSVQADVIEWTADVGLLFGFNVAQHIDRIESALRNLHGFIDELLSLRRCAPRNDLLSALIAAEEGGELLTDGELRSMVITLLSAGHGTVQHQLGNAMSAFMAHPQQWELLAAQPNLAIQAAEEVVRYCPSALLGVPRIAKSAFALHGVDFPSGACILPVTGSANRDASVFEAADTLDIGRRRSTHLTYGGGIHYCLGAALARVELQEALPRLAARLGDPHPTGPGEWLPPTEAVYGPIKLPIGYQPVR